MIKINNMVITEVDNKAMEDGCISQLVQSATKDLPFEGKKVKVSKQNGTYTIEIWKGDTKVDFYMSTKSEFIPPNHKYKIVCDMTAVDPDLVPPLEFYKDHEIVLCYLDDYGYGEFILNQIHTLVLTKEMMDAGIPKEFYKLKAC